MPSKLKTVLFKETRFAFDSLPPRLKALFVVLFIFFVGSLGVLVWRLNQNFIVTVPTEGGSLTEGVIGPARFVNPLLAVSDADRDLTSLVYSGLVRVGPKGNFIPDLAKSYEVSEDKLTYTFHLKDNLRFHDGAPLTADDVRFTIEKAMDPAVKSAKRANWNGVSIEQPGPKTIQLTLKKPYPAFLENATLGVLPSHLWQNTSAESFPLHEQNLEAIGSGPYKLSKITKDSNGIPTAYELKAFSDFALGKPRLEKITIGFYKNEEELVEAYKNGQIDSLSSLSPALVKELEESGQRVVKSTLPRVFAVFFNQNHNSVFLDATVRKALNLAVPRQEIVENIFHGYAEPLEGIFTSTNGEPTKTDLAAAKKMLTDAGWKLNDQGVMQKTTKASKDKPAATQVLTFSLATSNIEELKQIAEKLKANWTALGAKVEIEIYESNDLNQNVIKPRKYDALLFGEVMGRDSNPYPFWHSSQRTDPGLNIAMYTNAKVDRLLEEARQTSDLEERNKKYFEAETEIKKDQPVAFIYSPYFLYLLPSNIMGVSLPTLTNPAERFVNIHKWYVRTDKVWKIFANLYK
ncbi:MAG TPA: ABC transporter substrate-binding protein [Candidatus Paceibacterota bacterium]|jgi:peptide/nickel transport system substrate-binding protein|nr:ABC transporter substrate-binding protein [Candidatus Paceibacterota bacterium]HPB60482.1 ABC transporter substrate-binding protein [Candidatus Paceibacterota bacterium]HPV33253.1 ABC transporter substrate-binding protein [Candidatus Paceibacterota bacterium]HPY13062.1 ABC transporter substrate-binding protein [Candidatus Paceibacterota bacterium]HQF40890.1 ABC transporter substrate-binding protein [Candidatus Paceibacterota bacterium]